jgi:hypothetical protein
VAGWERFFVLFFDDDVQGTNWKDHSVAWLGITVENNERYQEEKKYQSFEKNHFYFTELCSMTFIRHSHASFNVVTV